MKEPILTFEEIFKTFENEAKNPATTEDELKNNISLFFRKANYVKRPFHMHFKRLHRARAKDKDSIEDACIEFGHVDKLKYPPVGTDVPASRCNRKGKSAFYCSSDNGVTIFEIRAKVGQYVVLGVFKHKHRSKITINIPIIGIEEIYKSLYKRDKNDGMVGILESAINSQKSSDIATLLLDRNLVKWFTEKVNENNLHIYKLTNSYYEMFINHMEYNGEKVKGLIYPSVASCETGYNIVIEPEFYDNNLVVESAIIYRLEDKIGDKHFLMPLKKINYIKKDGSINWKDANVNRPWILEPDTPTFIYNGIA